MQRLTSIKTFVVSTCFAMAIIPCELMAAATLEKPWMNKSLTPDQRTDLVLKEMTQDEKLKLVYGHFGSEFFNWTTKRETHKPEKALTQSAGYLEGVPRLAIPEQFQTDAGLGVASQAGPTPRERTSLPSGLSTAATWNLQRAYEGGAMIGAEARSSGFNVMLAGGVNLVREPRNGRNFEYGGEDPLLAGHIVGQQIKGIQSNNIISTLKHFAMNDQETNRNSSNSIIEEGAARMSDLLALQIAYEVGNPGSVMCSYNRMNGYYTCENEFLLNQVLKKDWGFKGYVMSDWGATHSTIPAANNGLDQESAAEAFDLTPYFGWALREAVAQNWVPQSRLDDMVRRVLRSMFEFGVMDNPVSPDNNIDFAAHAKVTQQDAEEGIVLLKNSKKTLPLSTNLKNILIVGGHADVGVLSGGGSSKVYPVGGMAVKDLTPKDWPGPVIYFPSSPMKAIQARAPQSHVSYHDGLNIKQAAEAAKKADVAVVFVTQWVGEDNDAFTLALPDNQDQLVAAVAKANPNTVVVIENGGPVTMPWINKVGSVLEVWYPGTAGGEAITRVLFGDVNPSGHLPLTFPASESQLPRKVIDGDRKNGELRPDINYFEGATVGYKWFDAKGLKPLFPFGHGLSYTEFTYSNLAAELKDGFVKVQATITNTGAVKGSDVPQIYVAPTQATQSGWESPKRLAAWDKVELNPQQATTVNLTLEPRALAVYKVATKTWEIAEGEYDILLATDAMDAKPVKARIRLPAMTLDVKGKFLK